MSVITYEKKPEVRIPGSLQVKPKKTLQTTFVVHRYTEPQLRYDFSIEINGVVKSWSVSKGPSMSTRDKRLAVMIQDHWMPGTEENTKRELWDMGTCMLVEENISNKNIEEQFEKRHFKFRVSGKKLNGMFSLIKIKGTEDCWLLIKEEDKFSISGSYNCEYYVG